MTTPEFLRPAPLLFLPLVLVFAVFASPGPESPSTRVLPLRQAHSHNDYLHPRPLHGALDLGFSSVEADVFLVDGALLVGHERDELSPDCTLESLYLTPLRERIQSLEGRVYPESNLPFFLLIDLKTEALETYRAVHSALEKHGDFLTRFEKESVHPGAVTVVISGNRPLEFMRAQDRRLAGYDGRISDLEGGAPAHFMPWISDNWTMHFRWNGEGPFPEGERRKLEALVRRAHDEKKMLRLWAAPDRPEAWSILRDAGVDLINTDRLTELADFLQKDAGAE